MTQNLQIASEADQEAASAASAAPVSDARFLIDHLNSALSAEADGQAPSAEEVVPASEDAAREAPSFLKAIMRQTDQIQYLAAQIERLDSDTEFARLREVVVDLCGALTAVTLRMKQDTSEAAGKIRMLMEAMTIIGGVPDNAAASHDVASILADAEAADGRLASLERISKEAGAAITALEDSESRDRQKILDLSAGLIKLNEYIEADREQISGLHQRVGSAYQALAQRLEALGANVEAGRQEIAGLDQRIGSTDQALAQRLEALGKSIEADRQEIAGLQQRAGSSDQAVAQRLEALGESVEADRKEIARLQQRIGSSDQAVVQRLEALGENIEADRQEIAGLHQRIGSFDQALVQRLEALGANIEVNRQEIAGLHQRIGSSDQALVQRLEALGENIEADRQEIAGLQQRLGSSDQALAQGLARLGENIEADRQEIAGLQQRLGSSDQALAQGLARLGERATALGDDLDRTNERLASVDNRTVLHAAFKEKIDVLSRRLEELEHYSVVEIKNRRLQESERNAALISKLEIIEQKNHSLSQGTEQMAVRLNAAEQTIATVIQRQRALSAVHDRVVRLLLANPDLQV